LRLVSFFLSLGIDTFIRGYIKSIKSDSNVTKDFYFKQIMFFFKRCIERICEKKCIIVFTKLFSKLIIRFFFLVHVTPKTQIMILKIQLCHHKDKLYFKIFFLSSISQYHCSYCIFYPINAALVSIRDLQTQLAMHDWQRIRNVH